MKIRIHIMDGVCSSCGCSVDGFGCGGLMEWWVECGYGTVVVFNWWRRRRGHYWCCLLLLLLPQAWHQVRPGPRRLARSWGVVVKWMVDDVRSVTEMKWLKPNFLWKRRSNKIELKPWTSWALQCSNSWDEKQSIDPFKMNFDSSSVLCLSSIFLLILIRWLFFFWYLHCVCYLQQSLQPNHGYHKRDNIHGNNNMARSSVHSRA